MATLAAGIILWSLLSGLGLFALSRTKRHISSTRPNIRFIFMIPAMNEGKVIGATVQHLLRFHPHAVIVIDDASDDDTAERVQDARDSRVVMLQQKAPNAQKGKGAALNAAYAWLLDSDLLAGVAPSDVVVCVIDADGRLKPGALEDVGSYFQYPETGACQISVRIRNKATNFWTRMQHFEFVAFTALYQRGRERTGAVGLGGNGQFARLSALISLGPAPWTDCLVEDMDLGLRLMLNGWRNRYVPTSWVSQQAVPDLGRLVRQRTRWFQGTLQCTKHIPGVMAAHRLPLRTRVDLVGVLLAPLLLLVASPLIVLGWFWMGVTLAHGGNLQQLLMQLLVGYVITVLPALLLSYAFWLEEPDVTLPESIIAGHLFVAYGYMWIFSGWRALGRQVARRSSWAKTARVDEPVPDPILGGVAV